MRIVRTLALTILLGGSLCPAIPAANAQVSIGISINIEPPPLPVYDQPIIPGPGYLWTPGYWAWNGDIDDYYWVPGTWVQPPEPGVLWTPGYWAWNDGAYVFNDGYWGPEIGFYGGVNYGFGYGGVGYEGGYWNNGAFFYNRTVNNISSVSVTNVYSKTVVVNNTSKASFNGGAGGTTVKPTPQQLALAKERHIPPTQEQTRHVQTAAKDPSLSLTKNQGHPAVAATAHPAQLTGPGVIAAKPGKPVVLMRPATPANAAGTPGTPANAGTPSKLGTPSHALPGFSQQPGGKPGPAGAATTGTRRNRARRGRGWNCRAQHDRAGHGRRQEKERPVISWNHNSWNHNSWNHNIDAGDRKACHSADTASHPVNRGSHAATTRRSPTNPAAAQAGAGARGETRDADAACRAAAASAACGAAAGQAEMHAGPAVQMKGRRERFAGASYAFIEA